MSLPLAMGLALAGVAAAPPYDADIGPAAPNEHPLAPSVKALRELPGGAYEVWGHPFVANGHLFIADIARKAPTKSVDELDLGEIEGTFKPGSDKKRRYAVRIFVTESSRTIVPIRP